MTAAWPHPLRIHSSAAQEYDTAVRLLLWKCRCGSAVVKVATRIIEVVAGTGALDYATDLSQPGQEQELCLWTLRVSMRTAATHVEKNARHVRGLWRTVARQQQDMSM